MTDNAANGVNCGGLRIVLTVLRWMWIALFAILLAGSIAFHAPWKVLALCSILLLGVLVVPRRPRRYFWASVGWITLAATVWVFLPDGSSGWRPYAFEAEGQALLARHHVPDRENAAVIYEDICRTWGQGDPNEPNVPADWNERARNGPWRSEDHPVVAAWLDYHGSTVERLLEAAGRERCFFEDSIEDSLTPLDGEIPPCAEMRQLAYLLMASANRDWGQRGLDASMEKQFVVLKLGAHLSSQPEVLFAIVGAAVETLAMEQFNRAMVQSDVDSNYLDRVGRELAGVRSDWRSVVAATLDVEELRTKNLVAAGFYQADETGRVRLARDPYSRNGDTLAVCPTYWEERAGRAWVIKHWFFLPSNPAEVGAMIDEAYERHASPADLDSQASESRPSAVSSFLHADWSRFEWDLGYFVDVTASMGQESHTGLCTVFRRSETIRRGTLVVVALRRYKDDRGSWPPDLKAAEAYGEDLSWSDAWDRPFVYKPDGAGFILYSVGNNGVDEEGRRETEYDEEHFTNKVLADDVTIWPVRGMQE